MLLTLLSSGCSKKDVETPAPDSGDGTITWTYNGKTYTSTVYTGAIVQKNDELYIGGTPDKNTAIALNIVGINAKGVGTYTLKGSDNLDPITTAAFTTNALSSSGGELYQTDFGSGASNGSIVVKEYDKAAQKISGTFSFTAKQAYQTATVNITNGSFTINRFH